MSGAGQGARGFRRSGARFVVWGQDEREVEGWAAELGAAPAPRQRPLGAVRLRPAEPQSSASTGSSSTSSTGLQSRPRATRHSVR
jgi:hypothetical protein